MDIRIQQQLAREAREKAVTVVTHMHVEREANGAVAVVWVSTPNRGRELRELLDEDGLLPADVMESQACDAGFTDRRTGDRVLRSIPKPDATGRRDWSDYRQITDAIEACHRHIDRHARKALFDLQSAETSPTPRQRRQHGMRYA